MKTLALAAIGLTLASTAAMAAPGKNARFDRDHRGGISFSERVQISKARANLAAVKHRAYADGKLTFVERLRIRSAENRLQRVIRNARTS